MTQNRIFYSPDEIIRNKNGSIHYSVCFSDSYCSVFHGPESLRRSQSLYQYNFRVEYTLKNKHDDGNEDGDNKEIASTDDWWTCKGNKSVCMQVQTGPIRVLKCFRNYVWTSLLPSRVILYSPVQTYFGTSCQVNVIKFMSPKGFLHQCWLHL